MVKNKTKMKNTDQIKQLLNNLYQPMTFFVIGLALLLSVIIFHQEINGKPTYAGSRDTSPISELSIAFERVVADVENDPQNISPKTDEDSFSLQQFYLRQQLSDGIIFITQQ